MSREINPITLRQVFGRDSKYDNAGFSTIAKIAFVMNQTAPPYKNSIQRQTRHTVITKVIIIENIVHIDIHFQID